MVPAHEVVVDLLNELPESGWLFPRLDGQPGHVTAGLVSTVANKWLRDNEIGGTLHQFRHWFGTHVHAATGDLRVTQELTGHASPTTTAGYVAWSQQSGVEAISRLAAPAQMTAARRAS